MKELSFVLVGALLAVGCGDDDGGSSSNGGSSSQGGMGTGAAGGAGTGAAGGTGTGAAGTGGTGGMAGDCAVMTDCTTACTDSGTHIDGLMCANEPAFDVADCIETCEGTFELFEAVGMCVCEYHASLACDLDACGQCGGDDTWDGSACCPDEVTAVSDCAGML